MTLCWGSGRIPLMDRDEPRFSRATIEMIESGSMIIPFFNQEYRFDKPILTYWLMRVGYGCFGIGEFGARAHAIVFSILTAFLIYGMGRRWYGEKAGLLAGIAWLTCFQVLIHGRSAVADMPMVFFVALAQFSILELLAGNRRWFLALFVSLGLGFLAKGPVAILVPMLTLVLYRVFLREPIPWRHLRMASGCFVLLGIIAVWGIPALVITHGAFWGVGIQKHVVQRGVQVFNNRMYLPVLYYPLSALFSLFPWIAFTGVIWRDMRREWTRSDRFLAAWCLAPILIFSFYATQLSHYILPGFPAFMLLTGRTLASTSVSWKRWPRILFRTVVALHGVLALLLFGLAWRWPLPVLEGLRPAVLGMGLQISGLVFLAIIAKAARVRAVIMTLVMVAWGSLLMGNGLRAVHPVIKMQPEIHSHDAGLPFGAYRYTEPGLVFYGARHWTMLTTPDALAAWTSARVRGTGAVLLTLDKEAKLGSLLGWGNDADRLDSARDFETETAFLADLGAERLMTVDGLNAGRGSWVQLSLWRIPGAITLPVTKAEGQAEQDADSGPGDDIRNIM